MLFNRDILAIAVASAMACTACTDNASESNTSPQPTATFTQPEPENQEIVKLKFGWPPEMIGSVSFQRNKEEASGGSRYSQTIQGSYKIHTQQVDQGLLINKYDFKLEVEKPPGLPELNSVDQQAQDFLIKATSQSPLYVVGPLGNVLGFFDIEAFKAQMIQAASDWADKIPEHSPVKERVPTVIKSVTEGQNIEAGLISVWNREVAIWSTQQMIKGKAYQTEGTQRFDTLDFIEVPVTLTLTYHGKLPCHKDDTETACVKLEYSYKLKPGANSIVNERYLAAKQDGRLAVEDAKLEYSLTMITEPNTLIPHSSEEKELKEHTVKREGFAPMHYRREVNNTTHYTYSQRFDKLLNSPSFEVKIEDPAK